MVYVMTPLLPPSRRTSPLLTPILAQRGKEEREQKKLLDPWMTGFLMTYLYETSYTFRSIQKHPKSLVSEDFVKKIKHLGSKNPSELLNYRPLD